MKKGNWLDRLVNHWWGIAIISLVLGAIIILPILILCTSPHTYLIKDATIEQVEQMTQADPNGRVWYGSASLLAQGSNLLEVTFHARTFESHKIAEYLDSIGVEYRKLKVRNPR